MNYFNKKCFLVFHIFVLIELITPSLAIAQNDDSDQKKIIHFWFARDSFPISTVRDKGASGDDIEPKTFCGKLYSHLKDKFKQNHEFITHTIDDKYRFGPKNEQGKDADIDINCDANSITEERVDNLLTKNAIFSFDYFTNSSKYMLKNKDHSSISKDERGKLSTVKKQLEKGEPPIDDSKIAVLKNTTQYKYLKNKGFPEKNLAVLENRQELNEKLLDEDNEIVAYVSDEILIKGMLINNDDFGKKYRLIETSPWEEQETLAVIVYNVTSNADLLFEINDWIRKEGRQWIEDENKALEKHLFLRLLQKTMLFVGKILIVLLLIIVIIVIIFKNFYHPVQSKNPPVQSKNPPVQSSNPPPVHIKIENNHRTQVKTGDGDNVGENKTTNNNLE